MEVNTDRLRINDRLISHDLIDGEVIVIHLVTGKYYSIDKIGAWIWAQLARNERTDVVRERLSAAFPTETDLETVFARFIEHLVKEELLTSEAPPAETASEGLPDVPLADFVAESEFSPPILNVYTDMQALLLLDPIHEVDEAGWPSSQPVEEAGSSSTEEAIDGPSNTSSG